MFTWGNVIYRGCESFTISKIVHRGTVTYMGNVTYMGKDTYRSVKILTMGKDVYSG